jgi:DNA polymerase
VDVYKPTLVYAGEDQEKHVWGYVTSHGGKTFENIVQGIARDVLATILLKCENEEDLPVIAHVHDEGVSETDDDPFTPGVAKMEWLMSQPVSWAPGLPMRGDGFEGAYYHK